MKNRPGSRPSDFNRVMDVVNEAYPDGMIQLVMEKPKGPHTGDLDDTLADFIVAEAQSVWDNDANININREALLTAMDNAVDELLKVANALRDIEFEIPEADEERIIRP